MNRAVFRSRISPAVFAVFTSWFVTTERAAAGPDDDSRVLVRGPELNLSIATGSEDNLQTEVAISVDPSDPDRQVVVATHLRDEIYAFNTFDGGRTWTKVNLPRQLPGEAAWGNVSDPSVAHDLAGNAYAAYNLREEGGASRDTLAVAKSIDGGVTWILMGALTSLQNTFWDKPFIVVDNHADSPGVGNVYVVWGHRRYSGFPADDCGDPTICPDLHYLSTSTDGGTTWTSQLVAQDNGNIPDLAVGPGGEVYVAWTHRTLSEIRFENCGVEAADCTPAGPDSIVATTAGFPAGGWGLTPQPDRGVSVYPVIDVDRSGGPHSGRVYVAYNDYTDDDPEHMDIFVAWADPDQEFGFQFVGSHKRKVNSDATDTAQFLPWLDVDDSDGSIGIVYYTAQCDPFNNKEVHVDYAQSTDGGESWSHIRVSTTPSDESICGADPDDDGDEDYREYIGLHVESDVANIAWTSYEAGATCAPNKSDTLYNRINERTCELDLVEFRQGHDGLPDLSEENDLFGRALAVGDFDGDGFSDLAVGAPGESVNGLDAAGAVMIIYGKLDGLGLDTTRTSFLHEDTPGMPQDLAAQAHFGNSLAAGDFNRDGFDDLAIGVPDGRRPADPVDAGYVNVIYGIPGTLDPVASVVQVLSQDVGAIDDEAELGDRFGSSLVAGDFDGDGNDDLAIGVPYEDLGDAKFPLPDAGYVNVVYSAGGVGVVLDTSKTDGLSCEGDPAADDDLFGFSLAAGDFDGDLRDDLAIGAPGQDGFRGLVTVIEGTATGLDIVSPALELSQDVGSIPGVAESGDEFGFSLAAGDFDGDGRDDLAIGVPYETLYDNLVNAGLVNVVYGAVGGLDINRADMYSQEFSVPGTPESHDRFGWSLAAGNVNGDNYDDLAVGVPMEALVSNTIPGAGYVDVIYGSLTGLDLHANTSFAASAPQEDSQFGFSMVIGDFNCDGLGTIAFGYPFSDWDGDVDSGAVLVFECGTASVVYLGPSHDAYITSTIAENTNFGQAPNLLVGLAQTPSGENFVDRTFIAFDVQAALPPSVEIQSAALRLYQYYPAFSIDHTPVPVNAYRVLMPWYENTVTWNNQPSVDASTAVAQLTPSDYAGYKEWDVTQAARDWVAGVTPNFGLALRNAIETAPMNERAFYSKEAADNLPQIRIAFSGCGDATCSVGEDNCNCPVDCPGSETLETTCTDDLDNDCDDLADCDDPDCASEPIPCFCGNNIRDGGEQCDGMDDVQCSGRCLPDCTCERPGTVPPAITMSKTTSPSEISITWSESNCAGAQDYGIYVGVLGQWYSHVAIDCHDDGSNLTETVPCPPQDVYYLVVPFNDSDEGSYGRDSSSNERPPAVLSTCRPSQALGCP